MKKTTFYAMMAMLCIAIASGCFKEIDPSNPSNPGTSGDVRSGMIAYYSFDDGTGKDLSGQGVDGVLLNNPSTVDGVSGTGVFLNKFSNQYLNIPYSLFSGLSKFSVSFWIKDFNPGCIFSGQTSGNGSYSDAPAFWATQDSKFRIKCSHGETEYYGYDFSYNYVTEGIQSGSWHHIVVVYNSNAILYIDGNRVDQGTPGFTQSAVNGCTKVVFGGNKEGTYSYCGSMKLDEIRVYNRDLTSSEVKKLYKLNN